jgi:molybdate transport system substrate-binding protein
MRATAVHRLLLIAFLLAATSVSAAQLVVLSAGAMEPAVIPLLFQFQRSSGHTMMVEYGTAPQLAERLSRNQPGDVLISPTAVMDQAIADGRAVASTRITLGRIGVGVFVRRGARAPEVSTPDALRQAVLKATAVVYTQGSSGQYIDTLLATLGVEPQVRSRIVRTADADAALARVASGSEGDIGFGAMTAIKAHESRGTHFVSPLPERLQNFTTYEAAIRTGATTPDAAAAFLQFLKTPTARTLLQAVGVE